MKTRILLAALLTFCLTSCASFYSVLTPSTVEQIQPGVTTEADLIALFGPPDTRLAAQRMSTQLDWFRSIPPEPQGYIPLVGSFLGGLDLKVQQLSVVLGYGNRVVTYRFYDSEGAVQSEKMHPRTRRQTDFRK